MANTKFSPDDVADCVLTAFDRLPAKRKPRERDGDIKEWVPLSGIVLSRNDNSLECMALGTGMKCLPMSKLSQANGNVLHDWHAEILAIRAFNLFLIQECARIAVDGPHASKLLVERNQDVQAPTENQPFGISDDVGIHMYCSEAPCGDASMELTMEAQDDATPWKARQVSGHSNVEDIAPLLGRGYFSELGVVRRKPARSDAPATLSKSCSDKLALKQCTSTLSSLASVLIHPRNAYLSSLVLPASQHVCEATTRAFSASGRFEKLQPHRTWPGGYSFRPFRVETTTREFAYSRRNATSGQKLVPSNISAVWTPNWQETLIGGVVQGKRQGDSKAASKICRRAMWKVVAEIAIASGVLILAKNLSLAGNKYDAWKEGVALKNRRAVKEDVKRDVLKGWIKNVGDDDFHLESA